MTFLSVLLFSPSLAATLDVPASFATVQDAVDAAAPGDTIAIAAGEYPGDVILAVDDLTIVGAGRGVTVLGPGAGQWAFTLDPDISAVVQDLTVTAADERGVLNVNGGFGDLTLVRVDLVDGENGALSFDGEDLVLEDVRILHTSDDDAVAARGSGVLIIRDSVFCGNDDLALRIDGPSAALVETTVFAHNVVGVLAYSDTALVHNTFYGNLGNGGSAILAQASVAFDDNIVAGNAASAVEDGASGTVLGTNNLYFDNDNDGLTLTAPVFGDPLFVAPDDACDTADFHLLAGSAAIDAASNDVPHDDIGAYAFALDSDDDGTPDDLDCAPTDPYVHPFAIETPGDGVDQDCDTLELCYVDADGDGARTDATDFSTDLACGGPTETNASAPLDCDDTNGAMHPLAPDVCDGIDNDCSGSVDDDASTWVPLYRDEDRDGFGAAPTQQELSEVGCPTDDRADNADDCDDTEGSVYPGAEEVCDGLDNDCNDLVDDEATDRIDQYADADADGYGAGAPVLVCDGTEGYVDAGTDCDDNDDDVHPGAPERCDTIDNDCDKLVDDGLIQSWWPDGDRDGFGDAATLPVEVCTEPPGYVTNDLDCDDTSDQVHPDVEEELCDGVDNDCDPASVDDDGTCLDDPTQPTSVDTTSHDTDTTDPLLAASGDDEGDTAGLAGACGCASSGPSVTWWTLLRRRP